MRYLILIAMLISFSADAKPAPRQAPESLCWAALAFAEKSIKRLWGESLVMRGKRYENSFVVSMYANSVKKTWTRTDTSTKGITCITDSGVNYEGPLRGSEK